MERDQIVSSILRQLRSNVEGLEGKAIDTSRSMLEMGATSLDVVEIVSAVMRELQIRIPRTQLASLKNIDDLADLLHKVKSGG
jgi:acyl carrier protein